MSPPSSWTDERKTKLKQWWLMEQLSSSRIAELFDKEGFHTTRNAVIGAVHRADWWEGLTRTKHPPKPRRKQGEKREKNREKKLEPPPPPPIKLRTPPPAPLPRPEPGKPLYLSVVQIGPSQCRYWYGESRDLASRKHETGYCGHKVAEGHHSWCPAHLKLVYAKTPSPGRQSIPVKF